MRGLRLLAQHEHAELPLLVRTDGSSMRGLRQIRRALPAFLRRSNGRLLDEGIETARRSARRRRPCWRSNGRSRVPNGRFLDEGIETSARTRRCGTRRTVRMDGSSMRGLRHQRAHEQLDLGVRMDGSSMRGLRLPQRRHQRRVHRVRMDGSSMRGLRPRDHVRPGGHLRVRMDGSSMRGLRRDAVA